MAISKSVNIDINEICREFNISKDLFLQFINQPDLINSQLPVGSYTTIEVIDDFINSYKMTHKNAHTTKKYYNYFLLRFKKYILENDPTMSINKLNEGVFNDFLAKYSKNQFVSKGTKNTYQAILRSLLRFAYNNDYINKDLRYRFMNERNKLSPKYLRDDQVEEVLRLSVQRSYGYLWRTVVFFLLGTGCRVSELVNLKVRDFNIEENYIFVVGKGNKERYIPMFPEIKKVILQFLHMTGVKKWDKNISGYLFTKEIGMNRKKPISIYSVQYQVHNIFMQLGIENQYSVHSFRHTFAVNCLKADMRLDILSQVLGHEDPQTTSIYTQLLPIDLQNEAMKRYPFPLEKFLFDIFIIKDETNE